MMINDNNDDDDVDDDDNGDDDDDDRIQVRKGVVGSKLLGWQATAFCRRTLAAAKRKGAKPISDF